MPRFFQIFYATRAAYPDLELATPVIDVLMWLSVLCLVAALVLAVFWKAPSRSEGMIVSLLFASVCFGLPTLVVMKTAESVLRELAVKALTQEVGSRVLTGKCVIIKDHKNVYAVTALNGVAGEITLAPTEQGVCLNGKPGTVTVRTQDLELVGLMMQHTIKTSTRFDKVLAAADLGS